MTLAARFHYFFPVFLSFCMPFGIRPLPFIIAAWTLSSFFNLTNVEWRAAIRNSGFWMPFSFFLATLLSAGLSENRSESFFSIEVKLSFLVMPYLFFFFRYPPGILKRCVVAFVSGCFFACVALIGRALIYSVGGHPEYFFYTLFSDFMHASYFAMYLMVAIAFVVVLYYKWFKAEKSVIYSSYFFVVIFVASIFLCGSKMGIISFFVLTPLLVIYRWRRSWNMRRLALILTGAGIVTLAAGWLFPSAIQRLSSLGAIYGEAPDPGATESTAVRILIWKAATRICADNFATGVGVGDANDALYRAYESSGLTGALTHRLNAHNQYLQTFIGMGIGGFLLLALLTVGVVVAGWRRGNFLLAWFALLVTLNFLVESMLQTAAGVIFFVFFYCFLHVADEKTLTASGRLE